MRITLDQYKNIPFSERGRDYNGIDCWGLIYLIHREQLGNSVPAYSEGYCTTKDGEEIAALIRAERIQSWVEIQPPHALAGDIVVLRILGEPWHCGIMLDKTRFAHMERNVGIIQDGIESLRWSKRIEGFYRWQP